MNAVYRETPRSSLMSCPVLIFPSVERVHPAAHLQSGSGALPHGQARSCSHGADGLVGGSVQGTSTFAVRSLLLEVL